MSGTEDHRTAYLSGAVLYTLTLLYAGTIVGPSGFNYVPLPLPEAFSRFTAIVLTVDSLPRRADWVWNVLLLAPLGFLLLGGLWRRESIGAAARATLAGLLLCFVVILAVTFAQLFFPPRGATLTTILARGFGAILGAGLYWIWCLRPVGRARPMESLAFVLWLYTIAILVFMLMPLDFALSANDLARQVERLPDILARLPADGRPLLVKAAVIAAGTLMTVPIGMLLTLKGGGRLTAGRSTSEATFIGVLMMIAVLGLSALVMSAAPTVFSLTWRTLGIVIGAGFIRWLSRRDLEPVTAWLSRMSLWALPPYLLVLAAANGLASPRWLSVEEAIQAMNGLGLLPLNGYTVVPKAAAARNIVTHAVMYAPVGVILWLRWPSRRARWAAAILAAILALIVEAARYLKPGLEGDINAVAVAAAAAWIAASLMPVLWWMLAGVALPKRPSTAAGTAGWRERAALARLNLAPDPKTVGDVEQL